MRSKRIFNSLQIMAYDIDRFQYHAKLSANQSLYNNNSTFRLTGELGFLKNLDDPANFTVRADDYDPLRPIAEDNCTPQMAMIDFVLGYGWQLWRISRAVKLHSVVAELLNSYSEKKLQPNEPSLAKVFWAYEMMFLPDDAMRHFSTPYGKKILDNFNICQDLVLFQLIKPLMAIMANQLNLSHEEFEMDDKTSHAHDLLRLADKEGQFEQIQPLGVDGVKRFDAPVATAPVVATPPVNIVVHESEDPDDYRFNAAHISPSFTLKFLAMVDTKAFKIAAVVALLVGVAALSVGTCGLGGVVALSVTGLAIGLTCAGGFFAGVGTAGLIGNHFVHNKKDKDIAWGIGDSQSSITG